MQTQARRAVRSRVVLSVVSIAMGSAIVWGCGSSKTGAGGGGGGMTDAATSTGASPATTVTGSVSTTTSGVSSSSSGGAGGAANKCATLPLCDDFEGAAANGPPDPTKWAIVQPDCGGGTTQVVIDGTVSHSGHNSVKVDGGIDYCDHKFFADQTVIGTLGPDVYERFYIRFADALGNNHSTFLGMKDANAGGKNLRMGGQGKVFMFNREGDDAVVPSNFSNSQQPTNLTWYCVELRINGPEGQIQTWIDSVEVPGLRVDGAPTQGIDDVWLQDTTWHPSLQDFRLGWESYSNQAMTVWFDDVALSNGPIGCD